MTPFLQRIVHQWIARSRARQEAAAGRRAFLRTIIVGSAVAPFVDVSSVIQRATYSRHQRNADLIRALGRGDPGAMDAFAAFISAPILQVIEQAPVLSSLYATPTVDLGWEPVIPLDLCFDDGTTPDPKWPSTVVEIRSPGIVAPRPHNTWCHGGLC